MGIAADQIITNKNQHLPLHYLHIGQEVLYQDSVTKRWFPATIKAFCPEPRSYQIQTTEGVIYRRTQNHVKPYKSNQKIHKGELSNQNNNHMQSLKNQKLLKNSDNLQQFPPKGQIKIPIKLDL